MPQVAVILRPEQDNRNSPYGFSAPKHIEPTSGKRSRTATEAVELVQLWLTPGLNLVEAEDWQTLTKHPMTHSEIDRCIRRGVVQCKQPTVPEGAIVTGTTCDYADLQDVRDIIESSNDIEWLRRCQAKDNRPQIDKWCSDRIADIESVKSRQGQPLM